MRTSPTTQIPADQTSSSEIMQKKLIVCPISSHEPVSVTFRKNVMVITASSAALWSTCGGDSMGRRRTICEGKRDKKKTKWREVEARV